MFQWDDNADPLMRYADDIRKLAHDPLRIQLIFFTRDSLAAKSFPFRMLPALLGHGGEGREGARVESERVRRAPPIPVSETTRAPVPSISLLSSPLSRVVKEAV